MLKQAQIVVVKQKIKLYSQILEESADDSKRIYRTLRREFPGSKLTSIYSQESDRCITLLYKFDDLFKEELR